MAKHYVSLIGPLLGVYYPLPFEAEGANRIALNSSRLRALWHSIYDEEEVDRQVARFPACVKLPDAFARRLDYDMYEVEKAGGG